MDNWEKRLEKRHGSDTGKVFAIIVVVALALWGVLELLQYLGWIDPVWP